MNISSAGATAGAPVKPGLPINASGSPTPLASAESATPPQSVRSAADADTGSVEEDLEDAVSAINEFLKPLPNSLEFSIHEGSGKTVVKLVDTETNTVLRQYPTKEALAIAKDIDKLQGLLIDTEA